MANRLITDDEFALFESYCLGWIEILGLQSWTVTILHKSHNNALGSCWSSYQDRTATIGLAKKYDVDYLKDGFLKETALHECLELLLSPLQDLAEDRGWDKADWTKERHAVIRTIENALLALNVH